MNRAMDRLGRQPATLCCSRLCLFSVLFRRLLYSVCRRRVGAEEGAGHFRFLERASPGGARADAGRRRCRTLLGFYSLGAWNCLMR